MARTKHRAATRGPQEADPVSRRIKKKVRKVKSSQKGTPNAGAECAASPRAFSVETPKEMSHEEVMRLPMQQYAGTIVLVATSEDLARAAEDLRQQTVIGFDTETQPVFHKGQGQKPPALLQLASEHAVYLFQLRHNSVLPLLAELLSASHIVKAGVAVAADVAGLKRVFSFDERGMLDIGHAARRQGMKQTGLRNLAAILLGIRISKGCRTSNWGAHVLSQQQIAYAATDAWVGRQLYLDFQRRGVLAA